MRDLQELPRLEDSITYLYLEHVIIEQEDSAIVAIDKCGRTSVPIAAMTCLLLGPGTSITHAAIRAICDNGCMAIWCGERAMRFYAAGIGETRSAKNLLHQAYVCMDKQEHLAVAERMYRLRFPGIPTKGMSLQQLRGMEGTRMRTVYAQESKRTGVQWHGRNYARTNWDASDRLNQSLSEANALLYGLCHAAIVSLGYSPGLGFIHTGKQLSFVYDIADLYKADTTIPAAFEATKNMSNDLPLCVRTLCREKFARQKILSRIAKDISYVLGSPLERERNCLQVGNLWDTEEAVEGGKNYGTHEDN